MILQHELAQDIEVYASIWVQRQEKANILVQK